MRVGINAFALGTQGGGIETYVRNVIRGLATIDSGDDYTLFLRPPLPRDPLPGTERMRCVAVQSHHWFGRLPFTASLALLRERIDVIHVQQAAPLLLGAPIVLTLHDIAYERYPQWFPPEVISKMRWAIPLTVRRAAAVLTDSEFSKRDVVRRYCVPPDKVVVAPLAADPMFRPLHDPARLAAVRERYGTGERFILCVGNLEPHKNLATLIEAYVRLRRADATRHRLVLVGRPQRENNAVFATARASGYQEALIFTGYVPAEDLVALFNAAHLFVFPSIFEGFGAPPLEAMACGTPVITSNAASLPEVVGDAAPMVDPLDVEGLASAIATVLADADLRARLAAQGLQRAAAFSWEATARIVLDTYRNAVQSSRRLW